MQLKIEVNVIFKKFILKAFCILANRKVFQFWWKVGKNKMIVDLAS